MRLQRIAVLMGGWGEEREISLKSGRYGPYVTDGETNASLRDHDDPDQITLGRAAELLAERRAAPRRPRRTRRR